MTTKYVADDGREFNTEKECLEWEKLPKVYAVMENLQVGERVIKVFSTLEKAKAYTEGMNFYPKTFTLY